MTTPNRPTPPVPAPPRPAPAPAPKKPARRPICGANLANGCANPRRRNQLMCRSCWLSVPMDLRRAVLDAYDPAAGIRQSAEWTAAAELAIDSLRKAQA